MKKPKSIKKFLKTNNFVKSLTANKNLIITLLVAVAITVPATLYVSGLSKNNTNDSNISTQTTTEPELANNQDENTQKSTDAQPTNPTEGSSGSSQTASPSTSGSTGTGDSDNKQSNSSPTPTPTPTPTPAPTPQYLTTCVYQGSPHNGENCPYTPPPAWNSSFTKYVCMNYSTMVACPGYRDFVGLIYSGEVQYYNDIGSYAAQCYFRTTAGDIQRVVYVNAYGATSGNADCLTAQAL